MRTIFLPLPAKKARPNTGSDAADKSERAALSRAVRQDLDDALKMSTTSEAPEGRIVDGEAESLQFFFDENRNRERHRTEFVIAAGEQGQPVLRERRRG